MPNGTALTPLLRVSSGSAGTKWVDPVNGNDGNSGTQGSPYKSINKAISVMPTSGGGIINVVGNGVTITQTQAGNAAALIHIDREFDHNDPLTIQCVTPLGVTLTSDQPFRAHLSIDKVGVFVEDACGGVRIKGFNIDKWYGGRYDDPGSNWYGQGNTAICTQGRYVDFLSCRMTRIGGMGLVTQGGRGYTGNINIFGCWFENNGIDSYADASNNFYWGPNVPESTYGQGTHHNYLGQYGWGQPVQNCLIARNVFYGSMPGYHMEPGPQLQNSQIVNNTFYHSWGGNQYSSDMVSFFSGGVGCFGNEVRNNLFVDGRGRAVYGSNGGCGNVAYNTAFNVQGQLQGAGGNPFDPNYGGQIVYTTNGGNNQPSTNPLFVDASAKNFHLQSTSPVKANADPAYCPPIDFDGVTAGATPSRGAFEFTTGGTPPPPPPPGPPTYTGWELTFLEEFDGGSLDTSWATSFAYGGVPAGHTAGDPEVGATSDSWVSDISGVGVAGGILTFTLRQLSGIDQITGKTFPYKTGMIQSGGIYDYHAYPTINMTKPTKFAQMYGKFEADIKCPPPAANVGVGFWLLPISFKESSQNDGEIDIMETIGSEINKVHASIHKGYNPGIHATSGGVNVGLGDLSGAFHTYSCEWDPNLVRFLVDNVEYYRVTDAAIIPDIAMYVNLLLQSGAAGDGFFGAPVNGQLPTTMQCSAIRVYQRVGSTPTPNPPQNTVAPVITAPGGYTVGQTLASDIGSWNVGLNSYDRSWYRDANGNGVFAATGVLGPNYALTAADVGCHIRSRVDVTSDGGAGFALSPPTPIIAAQPGGGGGGSGSGINEAGGGSATVTMQATITPATVGNQLTAMIGLASGDVISSGGVVDDRNGQWTFIKTVVSTDGSRLSFYGAKAKTTLPTTITVTKTAAVDGVMNVFEGAAIMAVESSAQGGNVSSPGTTHNSGTTAPVGANVNYAGRVIVAAVLVPSATGAVTHTYAGATTLTSRTQGSIKLESDYKVFATPNTGGSQQASWTSASSLSAAAIIAYTDTTPDPKPFNTTAPSLTVNGGSVLACKVGDVVATDGGVWSNSPTLGYQWYRYDPVTLTDTLIGSAVSASYTAVLADLGCQLHCLVKGTNGSGNRSVSTALTQQITSGVTGGGHVAPQNTVKPVLSGTFRVGSTISCSTGTWSGSTPITYTYIFQRDGHGDGNFANIPNLIPTSNIYALGEADLGCHIKCYVIATN